MQSGRLPPLMTSQYGVCASALIKNKLGREACVGRVGGDVHCCEMREDNVVVAVRPLHSCRSRKEK
jgi:hypothetical protein